MITPYPRRKIAVYATAKNEAAHVARFVESAQVADYIVVTDTGSTDGTPDLLRDLGVRVHASHISPWRFDTGFNCALGHVPADADICVKLDLDEVVVSASGQPWRNEIEQLWAGDGIHQLQYWYTWSWHVPGKIPAVRFRTSNVHARNGFIWRHPGHTGIYGMNAGKTADAVDFEIHHYMTDKKRPNYIAMLQLGVKEHCCPRTLFYLGREYAFCRQHKECVNTFMAYLEHPESKWKAERANAMRHIALAYEQLGDANTAFSWLMRGHGEYPGVRDMWWETLRFLHARGDFLGGYWAGMKCLAITTRDTQWTAHTAPAWLDDPYVLMAKCAWHLGKADDAIRFLKQGLELNPASQAGKEFALTIGVSIS